MKKNILLIILTFLSCNLIAQLHNPVTLFYELKKINTLNYEIHIKLLIEPGWHTYSQLTPAGGPKPTSIQFSPNPFIQIVGKPVEKGKLESHFEKLFGVEVKQFSNNIEFIQKILLKNPVKTNISGSIEFMVCNDQECLPPKNEKFSVLVN